MDINDYINLILIFAKQWYWISMSLVFIFNLITVLIVNRDATKHIVGNGNCFLTFIGVIIWTEI